MDDLFNLNLPYDSIKPVGYGGFGEVYSAYDPVKKCKIAIKCLRKDKDFNQNDLENFYNEAIETKALENPHIIPIYSIYKDSSLVYYTMPYIKGQNLKKRLVEARIHPINEAYSIATFIKLFSQICSAMAYAHSKNKFHGDLKLSNILIDQKQHVYVIDWGLINSPNSIDESPGKITGTIRYMAPEQITGKKTNEQSDIYALGLILYQLLTLRFPFHRSNVEEYVHSLNYETLISPKTITFHRNIPEVLSRIAIKCLEESLDKRYHSVNEIIKDLNSYYEKYPQVNLQSHQKTKSLHPKKENKDSITNNLDSLIQSNAFDAIEKQLIRIQKFHGTENFEFYSLLLHALRYLPFNKVKAFIPFIDQNIKRAYFLDDIDRLSETHQRIDAVLSIAYFLKNTSAINNVIDEIFSHSTSHLQLLEGAFIALIELESLDLAETKLKHILTDALDIQAAIHLKWIQQLILAKKGDFNSIQKEFLEQLPKKLNKEVMHFVICLLNSCLEHHQTDSLWMIIDHLMSLKYTKEQHKRLAYYVIWSDLEEKDLNSAKDLFELYPEEVKMDGSLNRLYQKYLKLLNP